MKFKDAAINVWGAIRYVGGIWIIIIEIALTVTVFGAPIWFALWLVWK